MNNNKKKLFAYLFLLGFVINYSKAMFESDEDNEFASITEIIDSHMNQERETKKKWRDFLAPMFVAFKVKNYETLKKLKKGESAQLNTEELGVFNKLIDDFGAQNLKAIDIFAQNTHKIPAGTKESGAFTNIYNKMFMSTVRDDLLFDIVTDRQAHIELAKMKNEEK